MDVGIGKPGRERLPPVLLASRSLDFGDQDRHPSPVASPGSRLPWGAHSS
jgi:hypothetical protein